LVIFAPAFGADIGAFDDCACTGGVPVSTDSARTIVTIDLIYSSGMLKWDDK
jgi:hypothetical protein